MTIIERELDKFLAFQDVKIDLENERVIRPDPVQTDMVEVPTCGYRIVTWQAHHPERGLETGEMLVSRAPYDDELYARNLVSEILWARGYVGTYNVIAALP